MSRSILPRDLKRLLVLEKQLRRAAQGCNSDQAEQVMKDIKRLLAPYGDHHRLFECKLWYFEALLHTNHLAMAESGFLGIRKKSGIGTRLAAEASFLLGICYLRQKKTELAKGQFREVFGLLKNFKSPATRRLLQRRIATRIEEEAVLAAIMGVEEGILEPKAVHDEAVKMIQKPEDEILEIIARSLPSEAFALLQSVREDAVENLAPKDRKLLAPPGQAQRPVFMGRVVTSVMKRIVWKSICDAKSPLYALWTKRAPEVFNVTYFATAVTEALNNWKIGLPILAAGVTAIIMRYSAEEFCTLAQPESIMGARRKRREKVK